MCFNRYLKPWLNNQLGIPATGFRARLTKDIHFTPDLTYLAQVKITVDQGEILAHPVEGRGSGDLANLVDADGFIELPQGRNQFLAGEQYPVFPYRKLGSSAW
jgi:molybdopterin molybdotransferase